jgi:hypothetical protein
MNVKLFDQPIFREVFKEKWINEKTFACKHINKLSRNNMATEAGDYVAAFKEMEHAHYRTRKINKEVASETFRGI